MSSKMEPHDVVSGNRRLDRGTLTSREADPKMVRRGLIVTEERNMEEIRVELSSKPVSFSQESAGVGLRIPACACLSPGQARQGWELE
jgi:hypothetical protein